MYVVLMEQCKYIIFHSPKPITVLVQNSIQSEDLFTKCHHHFKMKHFNQSWHGRLVYINEGHKSKDTQHFPVHLQNFVLSFYSIFGILKFSPFVQVSTSSSSFQLCLKLWSRIHSSWETLFTYVVILKMR